MRTITKTPIWVAYEKLDQDEDIWEYLTPAIESSTDIIVVLSEDYGNSRYNCQELKFAKMKIGAPLHDRSIIVSVRREYDRFNRAWVSSLLEEKHTIPYQEDTNELAHELVRHGSFPKRITQVTVSCSSGIGPESRVCTLM